MKAKRQIFSGHILTLVLGGLIYISFRTETLRMFKWFSSISLNTQIENLRITLTPVKEKLPDWILFSLPDGLWIFSYTSLILVIWRNKITSQSSFWILLLFLIAAITEIGQGFELIHGTYDLVDLIFYLIGTVCPLFFFTNLFSLSNYSKT